MSGMFDAFWRALAYCLHPRVIALSLMPLLLMVAAAFALGYYFWDAAVAAVLVWLGDQAMLDWVTHWLGLLGLENLRTVLGPLLVLTAATPVIVVMSLLLVAMFMTPAMVDLVARRRFAALARRHGGTWWGSLAWSLWSTVVALVLMAVSLPLWLVPPFMLVLPPLIWGWLTYRVFAYDVLADHASAEERVTLIARHRWVLLSMGVLTGLLGGAPSVLWASGAMFIALAPLLVPLAIWVYALVFAFAALWFVHFLLTALQQLRAETPAAAVSAASIGV